MAIYQMYARCMVTDVWLHIRKMATCQMNSYMSDVWLHVGCMAMRRAHWLTIKEQFLTDSVSENTVTVY